MAFRSPGARPSPRVPKHHIPEGPIQDFQTVIENTVTEDWQKRTSALQALVAMIPAPYENNDEEDWYNSAPTLRHLAIPLSELLKDARSTVVKRTCEALTELFAKCRAEARYLLKDMMPTVCVVHGCTVQVIRNYVQNMVLESLPHVPCKMAMPVWLDRLKHDKSRTVREACSMYLSSAMEAWGASDDNDFENENNGYLSRDIYIQVGGTLIKSMRDPSPIVRQNCKKGMEVLASQKREVLDELANNRNLTSDQRVIKLLRRLQAGETGVGDEMSVSSRVSISSRSSRRSIMSAPAARNTSYQSRQPTARAGVPPRSRRNVISSPSSKVPATIGLAQFTGGLGPPRRMTTGIPSPVKQSSSRRKSSPMATKTPPAASPRTPQNPMSSPIGMNLHTPTQRASPRNPMASPIGMQLSTPTQRLLGNAPRTPSTPVTPLDYEVEKSKTSDENLAAVNQSFDSTDTDASVLRPIATAEELRQKAKHRTKSTGSRRRSSVLQDRLLRTPKTPAPPNGSSHARELDISRLSLYEIKDHPHVPIHTKIAYELLEAHKAHVDQIMETLKVEMDALKDFELIMLEKGPHRPTEEEVLEYFESLGLCLEQRKKAGAIMQKRMDRISQG